MGKIIKGDLLAQNLRFALCVARFNSFLTERLLEGAVDCLKRHGAKDENFDTLWVPGSFELPYLVGKLLEKPGYDAIICLGAVVRGDTPHFDFIAAEVTKGIASLSLKSGIPVIYGVITVDTLEQGIERAGTKSGNKGWDAALSAIEMSNLLSGVVAPMGQRKKARELVLKCLYAHASTGESIDSVCETLIATAELADESQHFAEQLFRKVAESTPQFDEKIAAFAQNWDIERVAMVDRCILRIAICEFTNFPEIPSKVSINEAVELAKKYSTQQSSRFVNGILDAICKSMEP